MFRQLLTALTRIASAMETANILAEAHNRIAADKNELSREVLAVQQQLLECEQSRTVVNVKPDIDTLTEEVGKTLARKMRQAGNTRALE